MSKYSNTLEPFKIIGGKVTVDQAAWMTGKSNQAIYNAIKDGRMTADIDDRDGKSVKVVQLADLERLYQNLKYPQDIKNDKPAQGSDIPQNASAGQAANVSQFLDMMEKRFKEQLSQYEQEVEYLRQANEKSQETVQRITLLLEDKNKSKDDSAEDKTQKLMKQMDTLMSRYEKEKAVQEKRVGGLQDTILELRKQNRRIFTEMKKEKEKTFWQKLFAR